MRNGAEWTSVISGQPIEVFRYVYSNVFELNGVDSARRQSDLALPVRMILPEQCTLTMKRPCIRTMIYKR